MTFLAIITAGLLGIESDKALTITDPKKFLGALVLNEKEVGEYGIKDKMPRSLKDSLTNLKNDQALVVTLGPEIVGLYLKVKEKEGAIFKKR